MRLLVTKIFFFLVLVFLHFSGSSKFVQINPAVDPFGKSRFVNLMGFKRKYREELHFLL